MARRRRDKDSVILLFRREGRETATGSAERGPGSARGEEGRGGGEETARTIEDRRVVVQGTGGSSNLKQ